MPVFSTSTHLVDMFSYFTDTDFQRSVVNMLLKPLLHISNTRFNRAG